MADENKDEPPLSAEELTDSGAEDEEAMIALLKATSGGGPRPSGQAAAIGKDTRVQAIVRDIAGKNQVLLGLVTVGNPEARTSITLPPEDALRMAEKIFQAALKLPQPPKPDTLRAFLSGMLQAVQGTSGSKLKVVKRPAAKPKAAKKKAARPKAKKPKAGPSKTGKS